MNFSHLLSFFFIFYNYVNRWCEADKNRIQDDIYVGLKVIHHCFRILNGTHETGCQSSENGAEGVVHLVENELDVNYVLQDPHGKSPFIIAMFVQVFRNQKFVTTLVKSGRVNGFLVLHREKQKASPVTGSFSEDQTCPNSASGLYGNDSSSGGCGSSKFKWNPEGTGLRFIDWNIPAVYIRNDTEIDFIVERCFNRINRHGQSYPYCSAELSTFHNAAVDSVTCLRRNDLFSQLGLNPNKERFCDPLAGHNVFAFLPHLNKSRPLRNESVVVLAARMDSFSVFYDTNPSVSTSMVNVIAVLSIAEALGRHLDVFKAHPDRHLMIVLYDGESLDYIGSSRMVWDMTNQRFPDLLNPQLSNQSALFDLPNIDLIVELNQLTPKNPGNPQFYLHTDPESYKNPAVKLKLDPLIDQLITLSSGKMIMPDPVEPLPPASLHSFLKVDRQVPCLLLADHRTSYNNQYYNSLMDLPENVYQGDKAKLRDTLLTVTNPLLNFLTNFTTKINFDEDLSKNSTLKIDVQILDRLIDCFVSYPIANCTVFQHIWESAILRRKAGIPIEIGSMVDIDTVSTRNYIGIQSSVTGFYAHSLLSYFLGEKIPWSNRTVAECTTGTGGPFTESDTDQINSYLFLTDLFGPSKSDDTFCVVSTVRRSLAKSPAFEIENFDLTSHVYSTWTESQWNGMSMRLYLKPSRMWKLGVFLIGSFVLCVSLILGFFISKTTDTLFSCNVTAL